MLDLSSHPFFFFFFQSEEKIKTVPSLYGILMTLNHMVQQDYFPKSLAPVLTAFVTKWVSYLSMQSSPWESVGVNSWHVNCSVRTYKISILKKRVNFFIGFYFCLAYWSLQGLEQHILMEWARQATWLWSSRRGSRALPDWSHCNTED